MKLLNFIKNLHFFITLITIFFVFIINQKENTKLKILIWNTPSLSIGTYVAISTVSGYLFSYTINSTIAKNNNLKLKEEIKSKSDNQTDNQKEQTNYFHQTYDQFANSNTLIERDVYDPSPTINANFRVIGKTSMNIQSEKDNIFNEEDSLDLTNESNYKNNNQNIKFKNDKEINQISHDWEDDNYLNW